MRKQQASLPSLPVPSLESSLDLLLTSLEPLAESKQELDATRALCADYARSSEGRRALEVLKQRAEAAATTSEAWRTSPENQDTVELSAYGHPDGSPFPNNHWLEAMWESMAYLAWQDSISGYSNVFTAMFDSAPCEDPMLRAAWVTMGIVDFGQSLLNGTLIPDGKLCSAQYLRVLWTTRLPGTKSDRIVTFPPPAPSQEVAPKGPFADRSERLNDHIAVTCKGYWYSLDVTPATTPASIHAALVWIRSDAEGRKPNDTPIAAFTGAKRDAWADARIRLKASSTRSAESLRKIEEAMFHVVLSEDAPVGPAETQRFLSNARGAWLDKSTTIVVFKNGVVGANLEHAAADAVVPSRMLVHACDYAAQNDKRTLGSARDVFKGAAKTAVRLQPWGTPSLTQGLARVDFDVDAAYSKDARAARDALERLYAESIVACATCPTVGAKEMKAAGMAPDSFVQLALQLAYARDQYTSVPPPTYETASARAFFHGRTETIRTQSAASRAMVEALLRGEPAAKVRGLALQAATAHKDFTKRSSTGHGADRLVLALRLIGMEGGQPLHPLFKDPLFNRGADYKLSTSQLPWVVYDHPGFGAPYPEAYGCCYRFAPVGTVATVTSRATCPGKNATRFAKELERALVDLHRVLIQGAAAAPAAGASKL